MKNVYLFIWAMKHLKLENDEFKLCLRNRLLLELMDLSGVTMDDVDLVWIENNKVLNVDFKIGI